MSFSNDPCNPIDRIRMTVGDTNPLNEYVADAWYMYYLSELSSETLTAIEIAKKILVNFSGNTREKVDQVEIWGKDQFDNYLQWLRDFIENPSLSGLKSPVPYAGGISKSDMDSNDCTTDNNSVKIKSGTISEQEEFVFDTKSWRY